MTIPLKVTYKFNKILIKISESLFDEIDKLILKFIQKYRRYRIYLEELPYLNSRFIFKAKVIKTPQYWYKIEKQIKHIKYIDTTKAPSQFNGENSLSTNGTEIIESLYHTNKSQPVPCDTYKN